MITDENNRKQQVEKTLRKNSIGTDASDTP